MAVDSDELLGQMAVFPCNQAACYGKRAVHPSAHDHAAIAFHIQTDIRAVLDFRIFLDLERRGIAVSCGDAEELSAIFRHGKSNERTAVPGDHVFPALFNLPCIFFAQLSKTRVSKRSFHTADGMEDRRGLGDEMEQVAAHVIRRI